MNNDNNNVPVVLEEIEGLESALVVASRRLDRKRHIIAERDRVVAQHEQTIVELRHAISEHERVNIEQRHKIAELECMLAEHQRAIAERNAKIAKQERVTSERVHMIATIAEQADFVMSQAHKLTTMATAAAAAPHTLAAPGNAGPGNAPNTVAPGGVPTSDVALDDTASRTDDDTGDEMPESSHTAKRRRPNQQALEYMHPFVLIGQDVLAEIVRHLTGRQLVPACAESRRIAQELAGLEPFTSSIPQRTRAGLSELAGLHLLRRSDADLETLGSDLLRWLGLAEQPGAVVFGPRLCYVLVTLGGIRLERMTGAILDNIFRSIMGRTLRSLLVVTGSATKNMSADKLCSLAKVWARNLCDFVVEDGGIKRLQKAATRCNKYYMSECPTDANGNHCDPTGEVAKRVLRDDSNDSTIFLGFDDAHDLEVLCKCFFAIADNDVDKPTAERLRQIAKN
ncbi:hypothetical protein GGH94_005920 [Coemansia aciculifera]|uniref:Uncharacterized protein n=1 Tax=Coemansia aciculifera TaxID=417176 RepID=A0A9W8IF69_9FUNG|nr:hypothetical protein GGH94_005920 [Coemansia aciculifera]